MSYSFFKFWGYLPPYGTIFCAIASSLIPLSFYLVNQKLHQYGDPPWKKDQGQKEQEE